MCGNDVDQALVNFAADADWARQQGVQVERFNLAQQPMAFAQAAEVKAALERSGEAALPLTVVDGELKLSGRYPLRDELTQWLGLDAAAPATRCCAPKAVTAGVSKCC